MAYCMAMRPCRAWAMTLTLVSCSAAPHPSSAPAAQIPREADVEAFKGVIVTSLLAPLAEEEARVVTPHSYDSDDASVAPDVPDAGRSVATYADVVFRASHIS